MFDPIFGRPPSGARISIKLWNEINISKFWIQTFDKDFAIRKLFHTKMIMQKCPYIILFIFVQMYIWGQPRWPNMNCFGTSFSYDRIAFGTPLYINVYSYMYIIYIYIFMYMYIVYVYISFLWVPVVVLRAVWWFVHGSLMFWIIFYVKFPPLVLDLFSAFKLIMLSPSSRAASCHFWVLHPLRLRRHIS